MAVCKEWNIDYEDGIFQQTDQTKGTCTSKYENVFPCQKEEGHEYKEGEAARHIHTSATDGSSVHW